MTTRILNFLTLQMDKLMLIGVLILILLSAMQLWRMSRIYRQMTRFMDKLTGYLQVVMEEPEEEAGEDELLADVIPQKETEEKNVKRKEEQQKKIRDAQVFDAILSEIYP